MTERTTCPRHNLGSRQESCPECERELAALPDPVKMTGDERAVEMRELFSGERFWISFVLIHKRIEALVGRPVWTHEIGLCSDKLIETARTRSCQKLTFREVVDPILEMGKPVGFVVLKPPPENN